MVAKALRVFRTTDWTYPLYSRPHDPQKLADNLAFCARSCCRNPRRTRKGRDRLPFQEIRELNRLALEDE